MERASAKTRTIQRKLKNVEALPIGDESEFYGTNLLDEAPLTTLDEENYSVSDDEI